VATLKLKNFPVGRKWRSLAWQPAINIRMPKEIKLETQWHNLIIWGKTAEFAEKYLEKGNEVAVEGKISNRSYSDKEGQKKYITEIVVNEIIKIGGKKP